MKYTINNFRLKVMDCIDGQITSNKLGDWAYDAWFYYTEGKGKDDKTDRHLIDLLLDASSEWGHISVQGFDKFDRGYLQNLLGRIENYMNVEHQDNESLI